MNNSIAKFIRMVGFIEIIAGIILGLFLSNETTYYGGSSFNFSVFLLWSAIGLVSGMTFIGFAEIIELLQGIYNHLKGNHTLEENNSTVSDVSVNKDSKYETYKSLTVPKE